MAEMSKEIRKFSKEQIEVIFRKAAPITDSKARYPGFKPSTTILPKGSVHGKGALPLPCDIVFERDVSAKVRDGTTIYANVFRPAGDQKVPAIITWTPYGKGCGYQTLDQFPGRMGVPRKGLSELQTFEGPDPAYWCNHGYAIVNADSRGAFNSEGDIYFWGSQDAQDGYDFIEWVGIQKWCNGKVGMTGNSWLAIAQWFIASTNPPHLSAIAPWEGITDLYRQDVCRGGIPEPGFNETILMHLYGNNRVEDIPAMVAKYPLMNAYWEDKKPKLEQINVPAYVVASYTNPLHVRGTFEGFRKMSSKDKWLRVHNTGEWPDYYTPAHVEDLRRFFGHYLKGIDNGWEKTPRVRMSVLDPGGTDVVGRPENEFPLARAHHQKLFLDAATGRLSPDPVTKESIFRYKADDGKGKATFTITFDQDTELTGYMKLHLWVEAEGCNDMDLFVFIQKLNSKGKRLGHRWVKLPNPFMSALTKFSYSRQNKKVEMMFYSGPNSRLRVSQRQIDTAKSTESEPYHTHAVEEPLSPGQIVPVEISLLPTSIRYHAGQQLRVIVQGYNLIDLSAMMPGIAAAPTRNKGEHIIHTGGRYDSYLLVPMIPLSPQ
jgi:predicted acyl esterase